MKQTIGILPDKLPWTQKMKIKKKTDGWWIVDVPEGVLEMGPYRTKSEANEDMRGVDRFLKADATGRYFMSVDSPKRREGV